VNEQTGVIALCAALIAILSWIVKRLLTAMTNDLAHIKSSLDTLPCRKWPVCPAGEKEEKP